MDDDRPLRTPAALDRLRTEDLDPLSVDELHARIAMLEAEIVRVRARLARAADQRSSAEGLFRR